MNAVRIFLVAFCVFTATMVFGNDEKPAKEHPKDVREEINTSAGNTGKKVKKDFKNARKQVNKPWKKITENRDAKSKD